MKLIQRWRQTALHNKALVVTSVLVAFGTLFYAAAAAFQVWLMNEAAKESAAQMERLVGSINASISAAVTAGQKSLNQTLQQNQDAFDKVLSQAKASMDSSTVQ